MGGDRLCNIESMAGGAWYVNRKETRWGQGDIVVERRSEGCVRVKKEAKKKWETSGRQDERDSYRQTNKEANKEVARSNAQAMDEVYSKSCKH